MIVTRSFASDLRMRAGTEVLTLNGVPVADILARLMTVARADGNNDAKRVAYVQVDGTSRYEAFDIFWPLFFPSTSPVVTLRVRDVEASQGLGAAPDLPLWELRLLDHRLGYLRMPSWVLYDSKWNWRASLNETFGTLNSRGATDLVIPNWRPCGPVFGGQSSRQGRCAERERPTASPGEPMGTRLGHWRPKDLTEFR